MSKPFISDFGMRISKFLTNKKKLFLCFSIRNPQSAFRN